MSEDKTFIAIVSKHCKAFNFAISLLSLAIQTAFMLCFNLFLLPLLKWHLLCALYKVIDFDVF